jgi:hypothetical protein
VNKINYKCSGKHEYSVTREIKQAGNEDLTQGEKSPITGLSWWHQGGHDELYIAVIRMRKEETHTNFL